MILLADENIDGVIIRKLRQAGHQVLSVAEMSPSISDNEVLDLSNSKAALLLTADRDFGELVFRNRRATHGVILIRLPGQPSEQKALIVANALEVHGPEMQGRFTTISDALVRIRQIDA